MYNIQCTWLNFVVNSQRINYTSKWLFVADNSAWSNFFTGNVCNYQRYTITVQTGLAVDGLVYGV
jgi:hypothetical protein